MPVYKENDSNTWRSQFYYTDWTGKKHKKNKRGFKTKREAQQYEAEFVKQARADMDMMLSSFVEVYLKDKEVELKQRTLRNKRYMFETHVIPYLGNKKMNEITASDILAWQKAVKDSKDYSDAYLRMLQNQVTALFIHAQRIYYLKDNPCKRVKKMGRSDNRSLNFWTLEEYRKFIDTFDKGSMHYLMFELLFWTGMREGELLALTKNDIDVGQMTLRINKTYFRLHGEDVITTPKTDSSIRTIDLPKFLVDEVQDYWSKLYKHPSDARLFPVVAEALQHIMARHIKKAEVKKIRVHDLRHSHCAYLINQGIQPLIIKERLGHKDIKVTLNTYGHLYPSEQKRVANLLNDLNRNAPAKDQGTIE
ncbi:site-specific integrase [Butyrivibrio sp. CB08]|uniref:site-specific integrase n=1 Tax=Butyrivibrio sp. CB08 TaxID=2364879 RepID=UPI000EA9CB7C|nr:site-specific integrase [Butyrivibrio sp. CB08]RKM60584.1 site-specific integrase [Butyrivibrio sp. CB08]